MYIKITTILFCLLFYIENSRAGAWTLPKGQIWLKSAISYLSTQTRFCTEQDALSLAFQDVGCTSPGHSAPFDPFSGGKIEALTVFNEVRYGTTGWLDLGVQIPFYSLRFTNLADPDRAASNGIGDIRFFGKLRLTNSSFVSSINLAAKSPTGKFDIDAEVVNVSEGQWDFEAFAEVGKSLWPIRGYANMGIGYRIRTDNENFEYSMPDEILAVFEAGYFIFPSLLVKGSVDWLRGGAPTLKNIGEDLLWHRELLTISPSLIYTPIDNFQIETSLRFAFSGRDYPDGTQFLGSITYSLNLIE